MNKALVFRNRVDVSGVCRGVQSGSKIALVLGLLAISGCGDGSETKPLEDDKFGQTKSEMEQMEMAVRRGDVNAACKIFLEMGSAFTDVKSRDAAAGKAVHREKILFEWLAMGVYDYSFSQIIVDAECFDRLDLSHWAMFYLAQPQDDPDIARLAEFVVTRDQ